MKMKKTLFFISFFMGYLPLCVAADNLLNQLNGIGENAFVEEEGYIIYNGQHSPQEAVNIALDTIGLTKGYGVAGIDPFKWYTKKEYQESLLSWYGNQYLKRRIDWESGTKASGWEILSEAYENLGSNVIKMALEAEQRVRQRKEWWESLAKQIIPSIIKATARPIVLGSIVLIISFPLIIWHGSKAFFNWVFAPRPTILGPNDSDIYKSWWRRLIWKAPDHPDFIANQTLEDKMRDLVEKNQDITWHNKNNPRSKIPYYHMLAYGAPGVGKTLFAKKIAGASGMHFMYFSSADLCQLSSESALIMLKSLFAYARRWAPCVLIVDECDRLFSAKDEKTQKLATLFQKEFSKASDTQIQLFLINNFPSRLPRPIIGRTSPLYRVQFSIPDFHTQKRLFAHHLERTFSKYGQAGEDFFPDFTNWISHLKAQKINGLVGRDIEVICADLALRLVYNQGCESPVKVFLSVIEQAQEANKQLQAFAKKSK